MLKTRFVINQALTTCLVSAAWTTVKPALATAASAEKGQHVEIRISVGQQVMTAVLDDTPTARDSIALLPLTVTLRDYSTAEKVSEALPRRLSEYGAPANAAGEIGDIAYYAPWGNIAFYRGQGPDAPGVIRIGKILNGSEALCQSGQISTTISRVE
ncbi:cyclophilin-like fold protein [Kluyvera ascorbata]|uniref:cyclophilin-like fold protein n=1 Tax=Kluyvera ascorbata TaxID=51288 RepID=UPI0028A1456C|nr:cyclophilin-like fold protein [Kluyvera ascorbata]